ncbi:unnamed protein product, partial [Iphiclides podalirius]
MKYSDTDILAVWHTYYDQLLNTTTRGVNLPHEPKNKGLIPSLRPQEVETALKKMANKKSPGPDGIPVEAWKCLGERGVYILTHLFQKAIESSSIPDVWRLRAIVPLYKEKCNRTISQEFRAKNKPLYLAFLDMEKAFDRVPRQTIWWSLRKKNIPERYVVIIADMYGDVTSVVRTMVGHTKPIAVTKGVHQGSILSPYLFFLKMDTLTEKAQTLTPWTFICADNVQSVRRPEVS